jgi:tagaturonate reductase
MRRLDASYVTQPRPKARILQFGGGNFLRGFFDWKIDRMNEEVDEPWGIIILRSLGSTENSALNQQDGLYTVLSRGVKSDGTIVSDPRLVTCVLCELSCQTQWQQILDFGCDPDISVVVSNSTEAGIVYDPAAKLSDTPASSFPAKVTQLLYARWRALSGVSNSGLQFIACELTDNAGDELRRVVLQHALDWSLGDGFDAWLREENSFHNTLVDRIVTGFPGDESDALQQQLGYSDACMTAAELFHSLVIEVRSSQMPLRFPLAQFDDCTMIVPDVTPYKVRKVAILNGTHTALCPLAILSNITTVGEALKSKQIVCFIGELLELEIKPFVPLPKENLDDFSKAVLSRFANPFLQHHWHDISLNGLSKFKGRLLDRMFAYMEAHSAPPPLLTLSLAAWLRFYVSGSIGSVRPRDSDDVLSWAKSLSTIAEKEKLVAVFLANKAIWGQSIDVPMLRLAVVDQLDKIDGTDPKAVPYALFAT